MHDSLERGKVAVDSNAYWLGLRGFFVERTKEPAENRGICAAGLEVCSHELPAGLEVPSQPRLRRRDKHKGVPVDGVRFHSLLEDDVKMLVQLARCFLGKCQVTVYVDCLSVSTTHVGQCGVNLPSHQLQRPEGVDVEIAVVRGGGKGNLEDKRIALAILVHRVRSCLGWRRDLDSELHCRIRQRSEDSEFDHLVHQVV